jgi:hypothetical protein
MKSLAQSLSLLRTSTLVSGCMCMMPMDDKSRNKMAMDRCSVRGNPIEIRLALAKHYSDACNEESPHQTAA